MTGRALSSVAVNGDEAGHRYGNRGIGVGNKANRKPRAWGLVHPCGRAPETCTAAIQLSADCTVTMAVFYGQTSFCDCRLQQKKSDSISRCPFTDLIEALIDQSAQQAAKSCRLPYLPTKGIFRDDNPTKRGSNVYVCPKDYYFFKKMGN